MGAEGTISCPFDRKKSRKACRISALVIINAAPVGLIFVVYRAIFVSPVIVGRSLLPVDTRFAKAGKGKIFRWHFFAATGLRACFMKKIKYYYNTNTLRYEKLETPLRVKLLRVFGFIAAALVTAGLISYVAFQFIGSPREKILQQQNEDLRDNYRQLKDRIESIQQQMQELEKRDNNVYRAIFEANPIPDSARAKELENKLEIATIQKLKDNQLVTAIVNTLDNLTSRLAAQKKSYDEVEDLVKNKQQLLSHTPAIQPVSNKDLNRIASGFGYRIDPVYKTTKFHAGLDFSAPQGTPIYATADGTVTTAGSTGNGYGNHVVIQHGYGYETLYGHMVRVKVRGGQTIKRGEVIGWVGSTGKSTGPHCHYEVHKNGEKIDPIYFFYNDLTPEQFDMLLKKAAASNQSFD
jgi:murein DD-endopeptidase MepM/ murein hydrolase activator NlpD